MSEADRIAAQSLRCELRECMVCVLLGTHCNYSGRPKSTWCLAVQRLPSCVVSNVYLSTCALRLSLVVALDERNACETAAREA